MEDNGGLNANTAATLALLADTTRAGRGGMYGGGYGEGGYGNMMYPGNSNLAADAHANGTATKEAIDCSVRQFDAGLNRVSDQAEESRRTAQFTTIIDDINTNNLRSTDNQFRAELRTTDKIAALQSEINANARVADKCCCDVQKAIADAAKDAAKCCCDAKLEACKNTNEILASASRDKAEILTAISAIKDRELNAANAKITQLETINALSHQHH